MQKVYTCSQASQIEKLAKEKYGIPPFLMMEEAARQLADFIMDFQPESLLILCGKGNNGGDGYAVARLLQGKCRLKLFCLEPPAAEEAKVQFEMCRRLGIDIVQPDNSQAQTSLPQASIILDCIYGSGFHGQLPQIIKTILDQANQSEAIKIACDIPSGLYFRADYTLTMGSYKLSLFSDKAKDSCGKIIKCEIGLASKKLEEAANGASEMEAATVELIESSDVKLPLRKKRSAHKGNYGHTAVFSGDKGGACILAATAAMNFGSGLTSIINHTGSELSQFKISPALMISDKLPKKTSCILLGPGLIDHNPSDDQIIGDYFSNGDKRHAAVFDAGVFDMKSYIEEIQRYSQEASNQLVLTPHLSELQRFLKRVKEFYPEVSYTEEEISIESLANSPEIKIKIGREINRLFPAAALIMKSANTFIAYQGKTYIITDGSQNLAKGGSGDILAGMLAALLAQGYTALDAAITACEHHALTGRKLDAEGYNLTPEKFISLL